MKRLAMLSCIGLVGLTGCYRVAVSTGRAPSGVVHESMANTFLFGLVGADESAPCPPAVIETRQGVLDWLIGGVTFGLWTPRTVKVVCAAE